MLRKSLSTKWINSSTSPSQMYRNKNSLSLNSYNFACLWRKSFQKHNLPLAYRIDNNLTLNPDFLLTKYDQISFEHLFQILRCWNFSYIDNKFHRMTFFKKAFLHIENIPHRSKRIYLVIKKSCNQSCILQKKKNMALNNKFIKIMNIS